ncbi:MAG TPA: hypothetical protein VJ201_00485 [Candidatus Babeliales bacterium]|nr:hypothetical protein [Candidatus Babeliales bacterium]
MKVSFFSFDIFFSTKQNLENRSSKSHFFIELNKASCLTFGASGSRSEASHREIYDNDHHSF